MPRLIECQDASKKVSTGDELEIDLDGGTIKNLTKDEEYLFLPFPPFVLEMLSCKGLLNKITKLTGDTNDNS